MTRSTSPPYISCVTTLYKSAAFIEEFVRRADRVLSEITDHYEIILVNDGSPGDDQQVATGLLPDYPRVRLLELSRNFGHHAAILAGLEQARGDLVFFVDSDMEEAPELVKDFLKALQSSDADVVYGIHERREEPLIPRLAGGLFWRLLGWLTDQSIPRNIANVRLMRRHYVRALLDMPDRNIFLGGMFSWPGFRQKAIRIVRTPRKGPPSYSFAKRMRLAARAMLAFSDKPLFLMFITGLTVSGFSFLFGLFWLVKKLLHPELVLSGFTSLMVSIWFLGGIIIGALGLLGLYIAQIYNQTRARPRYIIRSENNQIRDIERPDT